MKTPHQKCRLETGEWTRQTEAALEDHSHLPRTATMKAATTASQPTLESVMAQLKALGQEQTRKTFLRHGAPENLYGVKVADLKGILKTIKGQQQLALDLWDTGNSDAMYLASLVADGAKMSVSQLNAWAKSASWSMLREYAVGWVAAEHPQAESIAMKWISSRQPEIATSGWSTYSLVIGFRPDDQLNLPQISQLLDQIPSKLTTAANRVRYTMNGFVIATGSYLPALHDQACQIAKQIGKVEVDFGDTSCKVPLATEYIEKVVSMNRLGKKRPLLKC